MTFTQIEYFIEVAKNKNFTKASKNLYVSQQVVSKQIRALEHEVGILLFDRSNKQIVLTPAGELLFSTWEKLLQETKEALERASTLNPMTKSKIRLGINEVPSIIDYMMPRLIFCGKKHPEIEFDYELGSAVYLQERLERNKIDLLVTFSSEVENNHSQYYQVLDTMKIDLAIVLCQNHPLASNKNLKLKDIKNETIFILKDSYSKDAGKKILNHFEEEGFIPKKIRRFDNINNMEIALNMCEGVTVAYTALFRNRNAKLKFYPTQGHKGYKQADLAIAWKNKTLEKYIDDFK